MQRFTRLMCVCLAVLMLAAADATAKPPGDGWVPFDAMTDEFNGKELDLRKWHNHNPHWKGREPAFFHPDCLRLEDGKLVVSAFDTEESAKRNLPKGYTHVSGYARSRNAARFGYFEARLKMMDGPLVSCFWLSHHAEEEWSEIDIAECPAGTPRFASTLPTNIHYFYGPHYKGTHEKHLVDPLKIEMPFRLADDFHTYGMEWSPTFIRWYVDDKLVREISNERHFQPLMMSINLEANKYFDAIPKGNDRLPGEYQIDWVRTWRKAENIEVAMKK